MTLALITSKTTGESMVVDFEAKTCTQPLHHEELDYPLWDYALDLELSDDFQREDWNIVRQEATA